MSLTLAWPCATPALPLATAWSACALTLSIKPICRRPSLVSDRRYESRLLGAAGEQAAEHSLLVVADAHVLGERLREALDRHRLQDHLAVALERRQAESLAAEHGGHHGLRVDSAD